MTDAMTARPQTHGFTLLELIVAIAIFAVIAALSYRGLIDVSEQGAVIQNRAHQLRELDSAIALLRDDLLQAIRRPVRDPLGSRVAALAAQGRDGSLLQLTRAGAIAANRAGLIDLSRIVYRLDGQRLWRDHWRTLDAVQQTQPQTTLLIDGIESLTLRLLDQRGQWRTSWPPPGSNDDARPQGVDLRMQTRSWGAIRRVIPLS